MLILYVSNWFDKQLTCEWYFEVGKVVGFCQELKLIYTLLEMRIEAIEVPSMIQMILRTMTREWETKEGARQTPWRSSSDYMWWWQPCKYGNWPHYNKK